MGTCADIFKPLTHLLLQHRTTLLYTPIFQFYVTFSAVDSGDQGLWLPDTHQHSGRTKQVMREGSRR